jgi:hypothetical protein
MPSSSHNRADLEFYSGSKRPYSVFWARTCKIEPFPADLGTLRALQPQQSQ